MTRGLNQQIDPAVPVRAVGAFSKRLPKQAFAPDTAGVNPAARWADPSAVRRAFTLVEMMVVIVIIGILAGLTIPALMRARLTAMEARVVVEIKQLESGIAAFKAKYGVEPPSQFNLYLTQTGWSADPNAMSIVRQIWPQFDFTMGDTTNSMLGAGTVFPLYWTAIAGTVNGTPALQFNGAESLLFFLGGIIPTQNSGSLATTTPIGFSKNPVWPFAPIVGTANTNREGPFFELTDVSRVKDFNSNGINEWYDSLPNQTAPILYFSSYQGAGYRLTELPNNGTNYGIPVGTQVIPCLHDFYRVSQTAGTTPPAAVANLGTGSQTLPAQKAQSCQLISPGFDGLYGFGGVFNPNLSMSGLVDPTGAPDLVAFDNLTNFAGGRLKP
ncbi:MAG TPA: prepilin-type N-terminal cleavage/methylation domain-containing protein [Planctomycetaceae bacterium]|jgi:general secretion pathway protein G